MISHGSVPSSSVSLPFTLHSSLSTLHSPLLTPRLVVVESHGGRIHAGHAVDAHGRKRVVGCGVSPPFQSGPTRLIWVNCWSDRIRRRRPDTTWPDDLTDESLLLNKIQSSSFKVQLAGHLPEYGHRSMLAVQSPLALSSCCRCCWRCPPSGTAFEKIRFWQTTTETANTPV